MKTAAFTQIAFTRMAKIGETLNGFMVVEVFRNTIDGEAFVTFWLVVSV